METQAELCETYQLKWSSHSTYLHSCIASSLHSSSSYTDVALITTDGHQIMAHRFVLSYSSQFLSQVLKMQPKVTSALPLMIVMPPEITHKTLKVLVRYMYSGEAKVTKDILQSVLKGGEILQVKGLYREKEDYDKNVKIIQQANNNSVVQTTIPSATTPPPLSIPNKTPVTINNTIPIKLTNNISAVSKPNSSTVTTTTTTTTKSDATVTQTKPAQTYPPSSRTQYRAIEPMPSTSGIPKEKLIQTTKSPQTFLVLQKPNPRAQVLNFTITHTFDKNGQLNKEEDPVQRKAVILNKPGEPTSEDIVIKEEPKENTLQYLMIKDEPIEWSEEIDIVSPKEVFEDITMKTEVEDNDENGNETDNTDETQKEDSMFSPLTCELCTATFTIPADWVRHVQSHTDMLPAKRRRRDSPGDSYENDTFPELMCDLCQQGFSTPAEWVKHIQKAHTEFELHMSNRLTTGNNKEPACSNKSHSQDEPEGSKQCADCNKTFPSHASMVIHHRKHTGEKPYGCEYCNKSFNVKSNLLRHLRTLHNKMISARDIDRDEDSSN